MTFPELLAQLRNHRGLTQTQLAAAAEVSLSTISVAETVDISGRKLSKSNALRVARALHRFKPLSHAEAVSFFEPFGISETLLTIAAPLPPSAQAPRSESSANFELVSEAMALVSKLFEKMGPTRAVQAIRSLLDENEEREFRVTTPPQNSRTVPGAIEQTTSTYRAKSTASIKRAARAQPGSS